MFFLRRHRNIVLGLKKEQIILLIMAFIGVLLGSFYGNALFVEKDAKIRQIIQEFFSLSVIYDASRIDVFKEILLKNFAAFVLVFLYSISPILFLVVLYEIFIMAFRLACCVTFFLDVYGVIKFTIFILIFISDILFFLLVIFYCFLVINNNGKASSKNIKSFKLLRRENLFIKFSLFSMFVFVLIFFAFVFSCVMLDITTLSNLFL